MSKKTVSCQSCGCEEVVKNGFIHNGNQNFKCKSCGRSRQSVSGSAIRFSS